MHKFDIKTRNWIRFQIRFETNIKGNAAISCTCTSIYDLNNVHVYQIQIFLWVNLISLFMLMGQKIK